MPPMEERVSYVESTMGEIGKTLTLLRGDIAALDKKVEKLDQRVEKLDQRFMWLMGIQFTSLLAMVGGMFAIVAALIARLP